MAALALASLLFLLPLAGAARAAPTVAAAGEGGRPLLEIVRQPRFVVALVCGIAAYSLMSLVMTAAPLAMVACGLGQSNAALGIQWHIIAMFGPSFFTGVLIARFGKEAVVGAGLLLLAACALVALAGINLLNFWVALVLLGLGWNFGFIGATAMLTETYRPEERGRVQGLNDFVLYGVVAIASFSSGGLYASVGWAAINVVVFPVVLIAVSALVVSVLANRRGAEA
jgi:MFS family permease